MGPFDGRTMADGSHLSLVVKNIPLTKEEDEKAKEEGDGDAKMEDASAKNKRPFRPRYDVTRDDIKKLFEPYGRVGIVQLRYRRRDEGGGPMGVAIVEFDKKEGLEKASKDLIVQESEEKKEETDKPVEETEKKE